MAAGQEGSARVIYGLRLIRVAMSGRISSELCNERTFGPGGPHARVYGPLVQLRIDGEIDHYFVFSTQEADGIFPDLIRLLMKDQLAACLDGKPGFLL